MDARTATGRAMEPTSTSDAQALVMNATTAPRLSPEQQSPTGQPFRIGLRSPLGVPRADVGVLGDPWGGGRLAGGFETQQLLLHMWTAGEEVLSCIVGPLR